MKISYIIIVGALLWCAGCATSKDADNQPHPLTAASPSADLQIISATFGSGKRFADVTFRVEDLIHQPITEFYANPEWLGADPNPGWNKTLVIVYEYKGVRHIFSTGENGKASIAQLLAEARK